jgi:hypothetical protein
MVSRSCSNTLEELEMYAYPEEGESEEPIKDYDHALDALRYAVYTYKMPDAIVDSSNLSPLWQDIKSDIKPMAQDDKDFQFDSDGYSDLM